MASEYDNSRTLFGGNLGWHANDWTASDDRVRGGSSQSNLRCGAPQALFYGHLDIKTLGGAGFASQRTTGELTLDLSKYDGVALTINNVETDSKQYTLILKDELLPKNPDNGREQATLSWEFDFRKSATGLGQDNNHETIFIPWRSFKATYRGKEKKDAGRLDVSNIRRLSIMIRSFFGTQEGDFQLGIVSVKAVHHIRPPSLSPDDCEDGTSLSSSTVRKPGLTSSTNNKRTVWDWLLGSCGKL